MAFGGAGKASGVDALRRVLEKGKPEPVYALLGGDPLLETEALEALVEASLPPATRDFNLSLHSGDEESPAGFLTRARSYPFMADRRVVVVRRFDEMCKKAVRDERAEIEMIEYLEQPAPSTVLVLVAAKLDRRTRISQVVERNARVVKVEGIPDSALPEWVRSRFAAHGLGATPQTCALLIQLVGDSLLDLRNEIDKVALRYAGAGDVGAEQIAATVGTYRQEVVWAINSALGPKNMAAFLQVFSRVLDQEDEPIRITAVLARQVSNLLRVKLAQERGVRGDGLARRLGLPPFVVGDLARQAAGFTRAQLVLWLRNLRQADVQMKSLRLPQRWVLERALFNSFLGEEVV